MSTWNKAPAEELSISYRLPPPLTAPTFHPILWTRHRALSVADWWTLGAGADRSNVNGKTKGTARVMFQKFKVDVQKLCHSDQICNSARNFPKIFQKFEILFGAIGAIGADFSLLLFFGGGFPFFEFLYGRFHLNESFSRLVSPETNVQRRKLIINEFKID